MWLPLILYPALPHNFKFICNTQFKETGYVLLKSIFLFKDNESLNLSAGEY